MGLLRWTFSPLCRSPQSGSQRQFDSAPALFLDQFEELGMELSNEQLISEAVEVNHAGIGKENHP